MLRFLPRAGLLILLFFVGCLPLLMTAVLSVASRWYWPELIPRDWTSRAWVYVISSRSSLQALASSTGIALMVTVVSVGVAWPAARAIALHRFPGKQAVLFGVLLPVLAPPLASAMGLHMLFIRYGLADSLVGVMLVHLIPAAPYCTLMLASAFSRFDPDYEDVAFTLGASWWMVWRYVTLPALAPGLAVAASFAFLISWSQYLLTLLIGGGVVRTLPLYMVGFQRSGDDAVSAAMTLVFVAPALFIFPYVSKLLRDNR